MFQTLHWVFPNFDFLAGFWDQNVIFLLFFVNLTYFWAQNGSFFTQKSKFGKIQRNVWNHPLGSLHIPNLGILGTLEVQKMSIWDIAIFVKIREFPWFWPKFSHITCDKTPTRHFSRTFSLLPGVTHRIKWENILKPVRMTETWSIFLF